jgi:hypothetical protein
MGLHGFHNSIEPASQLHYSKLSTSGKEAMANGRSPGSSACTNDLSLVKSAGEKFNNQRFNN